MRPIFCAPGWSSIITGGANLTYVSGHCWRPPIDSCVSAGNPIDVCTGAKIQNEIDIPRPKASDLYFERTYNSQGFAQPTDSVIPPPFAILGNHWRHNYQRQVIRNMAAAYVVTATGAHVTFLNVGGVWAPPSHRSEKLTQLQDGGWQFVGADDTVEQYDASGKLSLITRRDGRRQVLAYSDGTGTGANGAVAVDTGAVLPAGLLLRVRDDFGRTLRFDYSAQTQLVRVVAPTGDATGFVFDALGRLKTVAYPDGKSRQYVYYTEEVSPSFLPLSDELLTGIIDENGVRTSTYRYDDGDFFRRATATELAGGVNRYSISYPPSGEGLSGIFSIRGDPASISIVDPMLTSRTSSLVQVNGIYREAGETQPCGTPGCTGTVSTTISYNSNGNVSSRTDFNNKKACYAYRPDPQSGNRARRRSACRGKLRRLAGDAANRPDVRKTATTWHADFRLPATITEPAPGGTKTTTFTYDASGNLDAEDRSSRRRTTAPARRSPARGAGRTRTLGRVLTATDPNGKVTTITYYADTDPSLGKRGNVQTITNPLGHVTQSPRTTPARGP